MIDEAFIARRVTELRIRKGVSEYRMSVDMGHSSSYIHSIASGKALPSMSEFLYLCEYLGITPRDFFDDGCRDAIEVQKLTELSRNLDEGDLEVLVTMAERLQRKEEK